MPRRRGASHRTLPSLPDFLGEITGSEGSGPPIGGAPSSIGDDSRDTTTTEIGARQTTGVVRRRVASDVTLPYEMVQMNSSRVDVAGYREDTRILRVRFVKGGVPWEYYDVPPNVWEDFQMSESPGKFINSTLNHYPYGQGYF